MMTTDLDPLDRHPTQEGHLNASTLQSWQGHPYLYHFYPNGKTLTLLNFSLSSGFCVNLWPRVIGPLLHVAVRGACDHLEAGLGPEVL